MIANDALLFLPHPTRVRADSHASGGNVFQNALLAFMNENMLSKACLAFRVCRTNSVLLLGTRNQRLPENNIGQYGAEDNHFRYIARDSKTIIFCPSCAF